MTVSAAVDQSGKTVGQDVPRENLAELGICIFCLFLR